MADQTIVITTHAGSATPEVAVVPGASGADADTRALTLDTGGTRAFTGATLPTISGYIIIQVNDADGKPHQFTLDGTIKPLVVAYHAPWDQAAPLGTIDSMIATISSTFGLQDFQTTWDTVKGNLQGLPVPGVADIVNALTSATLRVTDLAIDTTVTPVSYTFGLAFDMTTSNPPAKLLGIQLAAFGVRVASKGAPPPHQ